MKVTLTTLYLVVDLLTTLDDVIEEATANHDREAMRQEVKALDRYTTSDKATKRFLKGEVAYLWWPRLGVDVFTKWKEAAETRDAINAVVPESGVRIMTVKPSQLLACYRRLYR